MAKSSPAFVAELPEEVSVEALERLYAWGKTHCEQFDLRMNANGSMTVVVVRKKPGTARDRQRNLRTLLTNWGVALPQRQSGWLRIVDEADTSTPEQASTTAPQAEEESGPVPKQKTLARREGTKPTPVSTHATIAAPVEDRSWMTLRPPVNLLRTACPLTQGVTAY